MRALILFTLLAVASAKPKPGFLNDWHAPAVSSVGVVQQPSLYAQQYVAQPVVHAAPLVQAAPVVHAAPVVQAAHIAVAKPATSYSSFQQIVNPVSVAQPVIHAEPVVHASPVVHSAPIVQAVAQPVVHAAPVVQTVAQPVVQKYISSYDGYGGYGHGW